MRELNPNTNIPTRARIGLIALAASLGLALTMIVVVAAGPTDFDASYKEGPQVAGTGDLITYTIIAMNTGDLVTGAVLSDALPSEVTLVSCTYYTQSLGTAIPSCDQNHVWEADFDPGDRITTTIVVSVTGSAKQHPMVNRAYMSWDGYQKEMVYTTTLNPETTTYLPLVMQEWVWWYKHDIYEPNDKPSQAYGPLASGQVYQAYMWNAMDQDDYYHFTPSTESNVQVSLNNIPVNCDYDLLVYYHDSQYQLVASSNNSGNTDESVEFIPVAGRKYYIRIYRYSGFSSEQRYHLTTTYQ